MCETLGSARRLQWFWKLNLSVVFNRHKCAAECIRLMIDLRSMLISLNRWIPLNSKAINLLLSCIYQFIAQLSLPAVLFDEILRIATAKNVGSMSL